MFFLKSLRTYFRVRKKYSIIKIKKKKYGVVK